MTATPNERLAKELVGEHLRGAVTEALLEIADDVLKALEAVLTTPKDRAAIASVGATVRDVLQPPGTAAGTGDDSDDELVRALAAELEAE